MSDLSDELSAYGDHCMHSSQHQVADLVFRAATRLLELESGVTVSREDVEFALVWAKYVTTLRVHDGSKGCNLEEERITRLRAALARQKAPRRRQ